MVAETGSTNADMAALAAADAPEGTWLRAERQTAGRGRGGRAWESHAGNLHASTLVRLRPTDPPAPEIALVAALAAQETGARWSGAARVSIKWPNDLVVNGAKLAGLLLERRGDAVIAGFGLNIAHAPALPDRATTCLAALGAGAGDVGEVTAMLAGRFAAWLERWRTGGLCAIRGAWLAAAHDRGTPLRVVRPDGAVLDGAFDDLAADGALVLRLADGTRALVHAGDVFAL